MANRLLEGAAFLGSFGSGTPSSYLASALAASAPQAGVELRLA